MNTTEAIKFDYKTLVQTAKELGLTTNGKAPEIDARIKEHLTQAEAVVEEKVERRGRPMNPNSPRQIRLSQQGLIGRGRPSDPNSPWNIKQRLLEEKRAAGELKLGRQINSDSERQKRLAKVGTLKRGRPAFVKVEAMVSVETLENAISESPVS